MQIFYRSEDLRPYLEDLTSENKTLGFVPTMGALHEGHASIIKQCKKENEVSICSIFVNPTQFNNKEDLEKYPKKPEEDIWLLEELHCDILFLPDEKEMYPKGNQIRPVPLGRLEKIYEGKFRPGHFAGVSTVVGLFFDLIKPNRAYFGLKDYQQYAVIKALVSYEKLPIEIVGCPTIREDNGLAKSSRNLRLSEDGKRKAQLFYQCLVMAKKMIRNQGTEAIKEEVASVFSKDPSCVLEYFELADAYSLEEVADVNNHASVVGLIAGYVEGIRLIDNLILIP